MSDELRLRLALNSISPNEPNKTFEYLYNKYLNLLIFISSNILDNKEDIEDAVQEVFTKFFNNPEGCKSNIKSYLSTMIKNKSLDILKDRKRLIVDDNIIDYLNNKESINTTNHRLNELIIDMRKHLDKLDVDIILIHLLDNKSFIEIGAIYNMKPQAVKNRYYRGLKKYKTEGGFINEED